MGETIQCVPIPKNGVDYRGKIVLAPMVRAGTLPTRLLSLKYGADLVWGPETVDRSMIGTIRRYDEITKTISYSRTPSHAPKDPKAEWKESVLFRIHPEKETNKLIFQLGTASPETAVEASKIFAQDVAGIDVNAGCPKPFSTSGGMGAALLETPELLCSILRALVKEVGEPHEIGISVKIRIFPSVEKTEALVKALCKTGIIGLTIHCRTPDMRPRQKAIREHLKMLADVCRDHGVACLMNGDVDNRDQALTLAKAFNVDGAMIARGAEANPSCFRSAADGGLVEWMPLSQEYLRTAMEVDNHYANTKWMLGKLIPGKSPFYRRVQSSKSYVEACSILEMAEESRLAEEVDVRVGISKVEPVEPVQDPQGNLIPTFSSVGEKRKRVDTMEETIEVEAEHQQRDPRLLALAGLDAT